MNPGIADMKELGGGYVAGSELKNAGLKYVVRDLIDTECIDGLEIVQYN